MTASLVLPARGQSAALLVLVGAVMALALVGGMFALQAFAGGGEDTLHEGAAAIGEPIDTSFGSITVERAQTIDGLTAKDMSNGMSHGIQSLVQPDEAQVAVAVYLVNEGGRALAVDAGQFRLVVEGRADAVIPTGTTIQPIQLQPGSGVRGTLAFVVPLDGARTSVVYLDPGGPSITIPVGRLDEAPADAPGHPDDTDHDE